jgi:hypothetical protein
LTSSTFSKGISYISYSFSPEPLRTTTQDIYFF